MADDDDTSAGLTPETTPAPRRRAIRRAGPPGEATTAAASNPAPVALEKAAATGATATAVRESGAADAAVDGAAQPPSDGESVTEDTAAAPRRGRGRLLAVLAGILVVALAGAAVWLLIERNSAQDRDAQRNAYVQTARQTVLNLTTIKPDTAKDDVDRILAGASGEFKSEFDGREDPFVSVVQEAGVTTVGKILEAGLETESDNAATVLVAARADVSTPDGTQNGPRDFRMRVTVTDDGGNLTASKVEFVP